MSGHDQLTALDATFLELEQADDSALMHIGGALVFEVLPDGGTPALARLRGHLSERLERLPRYRQRLSSTRTGGLVWPSWVDDGQFDIDDHVRHATLPAPGDECELLDWISDFYSHRLDRSRPLWEIVLLDGMADGRWALVWKTHHCLVDGVGSVGVVDLLLDPEPTPYVPLGPADYTALAVAAAERTRHVRLLHPPESVRQSASVGVAAARLGARALIHPREALDRSRGVIDLLVRDELIAAPQSSLNVPIGATRRIAAVHVPLEELNAIRGGLGGTINDVVLCAVTAGLRDLLLARGEDPPTQGLRAMVPVNIRRDGDRSDLGNRVSSLFVDLPVSEADPVRRYELVHAAVRKQKESGQALAAAAVTTLGGLAPPVLHATFARSLFAKRLFNVTITNVPASPRRLYAFGAPMVDVVPMVPLAAEHAVGVAVVSYAGGVTFGLCADRATVPDLEVFSAGIVTALRELASPSPVAAAAAAVR
jgi:WS/DGAT/MGAT family acyltransferase